MIDERSPLAIGALILCVACDAPLLSEPGQLNALPLLASLAWWMDHGAALGGGFPEAWQVGATWVVRTPENRGPVPHSSAYRRPDECRRFEHMKVVSRSDEEVEISVTSWSQVPAEQSWPGSSGRENVENARWIYTFDRRLPYSPRLVGTRTADDGTKTDDERIFAAPHFEWHLGDPWISDPGCEYVVRIALDSEIVFKPRDVFDLPEHEPHAWPSTRPHRWPLQ